MEVFVKIISLSLSWNYSLYLEVVLFFFFSIHSFCWSFLAGGKFRLLRTNLFSFLQFKHNPVLQPPPGSSIVRACLWAERITPRSWAPPPFTSRGILRMAGSLSPWLCWFELNGQRALLEKHRDVFMWFPTKFHQSHPKDWFWSHLTGSALSFLRFPRKQAQI